MLQIDYSKYFLESQFYVNIVQEETKRIHQKLTQITCKKPHIGVKYTCIAKMLGGRIKHEICNR